MTKCEGNVCGIFGTLTVAFLIHIKKVTIKKVRLNEM